MNISVIPLYQADLSQKIFEFKPFYHFAFYLKKYLEDAGHCVATIDLMPIEKADFVIAFELNSVDLLNLMRHHNEVRSVYIPLEPPVVSVWHTPDFLKRVACFFSCIFTWQDDLIDQQHFFKMYFPYHDPQTLPAIIPAAFTQKKMLTMFIGNKTSSHPDELYSKRIEMIRFFEQASPEQFEFYGRGFDQNVFESYRGEAEDKLAVMSQYKFSICFENQNKIRGYITEKILDCFEAKVIPIYLGADNITDYVPVKAFIDYRKFSSNEALLEYLEAIQEEEYNDYLSAAAKFLQSPQFEKFTPQFFARQLADLIESKQNEPIRKSFPFKRFFFLWALFDKKTPGSYPILKLRQVKKILQYLRHKTPLF